MKKTATPGKAKCEAVAELLNIPLERTIKSIVLATENEGAEPTIWLLMLRGDHDLNEIKASKLPGLADFRIATESRNHRSVRYAAGLPRPDRHEEAGQGRRGSHGREHERLRGRLERGGLPHHRRELGPRSAGTGRRRHSQREEGRSVAGRQGRDRHLPRYRSRPRVPARHQVFGSDERDLPRRNRQAAADGNGLLRYRRHAYPGRRDRTEFRRQGHHLAGIDCAVRSRAVPDGLRPQRSRARAGRQAVRGIASKRAST